MDWLTAIKTDENKALKTLYQTYRSECLLWLRDNHSLDVESSKEVFQSSVVILYDNVISGKLTELNSSIKTYLFAIARNKAREYIRMERKETSIDNNHNRTQTSIHAVSEYDPILDDYIETINKQLIILGDPCKTLLQLYYYKKNSLTEISIKLGYNNSTTVKSKKYQCIKRLQSLVFSQKETSYVN